MVNKGDAKVSIVYLSYHFDVGLFHVIGQEEPRWRSQWYIYAYNDKNLLGT
jgi:hypothetical protein